MSKETNIQWCDSTVNPIMGCGGCELYPKPTELLNDVDRAITQCGVTSWEQGKARRYFSKLVDSACRKLRDANGEPGPGHVNAVTTTNIYHLRKQLADRVSVEYGKKAGKVALDVICKALKCYAAKLHLNRGYSIVNAKRNPNKGYADSFEQIKTFPGRIAVAAGYRDLLGEAREKSPWLDGFPRLIFVSDMGDAFTRNRDFDFLKKELESTQSEDGRRHIWLWLSKRPEKMAQFADSINGLPDNICAMTTVTSHDTLDRVDALREVNARVRGLSLEPLWSDISSDLDLTGIDWMIVGGESGAMADVALFPVEWAYALRDRCEQQGVAFFLKQLGRRPSHGGAEFSLAHSHGGDWNEWEPSLRARKFPAYFHDYRRSENHSVASFV